MRDLAGFRDAVRGYRRTAGRTQRQLARAIGLHPDVLSHKLNGSDHAVLTAAEVIAIVATLAGWAALGSRGEAERLLALMDVQAHAVPGEAWARPPLAALPADEEPPAPPAAHRPDRSDVPPAAARGQMPAGVPVPPTPLIGRGAERQAIRDALAASRLVTLTGVGGTGKTRLAVQAAHEFGDGNAGSVAFTDLAAVREPDLLAITLARCLGLRPPSTDVAERQLIDALAGQPVLLVLDNLEHLLDATPLLARLLAAAPQLRVLTTSRITLRLYGETVLRVPPLALTGAGGSAGSEAVRLFVQRARAAQPGFTAEREDLAAVADICAALDGLPLAIELAAARVRLYPPPALLALLGDRLAVLTGGPRDLPHRQQTLQATLDWSHELLDPQARHLLACLGAFAGPFDATAAATVYGNGDAAAMLAQLDALCDHSLLEVSPGATPRFRLLQTVREYALARLAQTGEQGTVRRRHLDYYLTVAAAGGQALLGAAEELRAWLDEVEAAYPNIRAAFDFAAQSQDDACLDAGLQLAIALVPLWQRRLSLAEGAWQFDRLLTQDAGAHATGTVTRVRAQIELAGLECFRGDYPRAVALAEQGRTLSQDLADHHAVARAHRFLGEAKLALGNLDAAEPHFRRELAEAELAGDKVLQAAAYNMLGQLARHRGRYSEATALLRHALRLFGTAHSPSGVGAVMNSLGEVARDAGDADRAQRRFAAALRFRRQLGSARNIAYDLEGLASAAALRGDGRQALRYLGAAQGLRERSDAPLPPVEQAILTRILSPALAPLGSDERDQALADGRNRPLADTLTDALRETTSIRR